MSLRVTREQVAPLALLAALTAIAMTGPFAEDKATVFAVVVIPLGAVLVWRIHPAWTLSVALCLSVVAGNWKYLGIPGTLAPDRLLLIGGILAVVLRAPPVKHRAPLEFKAVHWVMIVTLAWMAGSALSAGTLTDRSEQFELLERFGLLPFALFLVAPVVFDTERHRRILLAALVGLGGYLGFTALMQTLGFDALVWPSYITDPSIGTAADRARGPFLEAVTNGAGLYAGLIGAVMALFTWTKPFSLRVAGIVIVLCAAGLLFTEQRSVWLAGIVTTVIALLAVRELRLWAVPAVGAGLAVVAISLSVIPGLASSVTERSNDQRTVWDRQNLTTAAENIVEARPLTGVGWGRFEVASPDYFWQNPDFPLTAQGVVLHNVYLGYAAETGLIGVGLWALTLALAAGAALRRSPDPRARPWQIAFGAFLVFYLVISTFVYAQVFPNNMLWLFAGVAAGVATGAQGRRPAE